MSTMNNSKEVIQYDDDEEEDDDDDVSYDYTGKKDADNAAVVTPHCTSTSRSGSNIETGITTRASSATTKIVKLPRVYAEAVKDAVSAAESSSESDFSAASSSCSPLPPPLVKDRLYQVIFYDEDNDDDDSVADCDILNQQTSNRDCIVDTSSLKYVGHKSPIEAIDIMYALVNHYASHVDGDAHDDNNDDDDDDDDENNEPHGFYHMKGRCFEMFRKQIIYSLALARQRRDDDDCGGQVSKCKYRIRQAYCKAQFVFCHMKLDLLRLASSVSTASSSALTESAFETTSSADDVDDDDDDDDVAESTTTNLSRKVKRSKKRKRQSSTTSSSRSKRSIEEETVVDTDDEDIESEPSPTPQNKRIPNTDVSTTTTTTHHHRRQRKNDKEVWYTDSLIPRRCSRRHRHRRPRKFTSM
jgi:hypothetical protein